MLWLTLLDPAILKIKESHNLLAATGELAGEDLSFCRRAHDLKNWGVAVPMRTVKLSMSFRPIPELALLLLRSLVFSVCVIYGVI